MMGEEIGQTESQTKTATEKKAKRRGRPKKARGASNTSDDAASRWTVRGIPVNVRDMAVEAAEKRGMTVGDWIAEAIVASAKKSISADSGSNLPATPAPDLVDLVQSLNERLTKIEEAGKAPAPSGGLVGWLFGKR